MHTRKVTFNSFFDCFKYYDIAELMKVFGSRLVGKTTDINILTDISEKANMFLEHTNSYVLITDINVLRALYVSPSVQLVTGYSQKEFISGGTSAFIKNYCPADKISGMKILDLISAHQKQPGLTDKHLYQYITTFRYLNKSGYYTWMYNRMIFMKYNENGNPCLLFSVVTGMEPFKTDDSIHFTRLKYNQTNSVYQIDFQESYLPEYLNLFGKTEIRILKFLSRGMDNAQMADNLNLSEHTIKDYRKRMLKKTWCDNTAELLCFALRNKII